MISSPSANKAVVYIMYIYMIDFMLKYQDLKVAFMNTTVPLINICFNTKQEDAEIYSIFTIDNLNCLPV